MRGSVTRMTAAAVLLLVLSGSLPAWSKPALSAADVFQLVYASSPMIDREGRRLLYLRHSMDIMRDQPRSNLWRINIDGSDHRPVTTGPDSISSAALAPDGNRVAYVRRDDTGQQLFVSWLDSGQTAQLTRLPYAPDNLAWSPDGQWLAFKMLVAEPEPGMGELPPRPRGAEWAGSPEVVERTVYRADGTGARPHGHDHVFVIPAAGGSPRQLTSGDYYHSGAIAWAADSEALFVSANRNPDWELDTQNSDIYRVALADGETTALTDRQGADANVVVSPDGRTLAYTGWDDRRMGYHRNRLYVMSVDGSERRELLPDLDRNIEQPRWSSDGKRLLFRYDDRGDTLLAATDLRGGMEVLARGLGGKQLGRPYSGADFAAGGQGSYAYTAGSATTLADIVVGKLGSDRQRQLTHLNDNLLAHRSLGQVEELWLQSSFDQRDIQAWIVTPPDFDPDRKYPLILEIHGGPFANYGPRFAAEIQLFAAAGYVVLYVNPRGSTGYGEEFANLIHHNYPSQDYDDLMSAVDVVLERGYVDPRQLYVTGGSGGGTLTAWIVGKTDRFRAAVAAKPVINWTSFVLTADVSPYFSRYWFGEMPWENPDAYWQRSPLSLVGNVVTPTMLLTGEKDLRTPMPETEQFYQALKLRGIDTAMVRVPGAYHTIARRPSQLIAKVEAILAWFGRYAPEQAG
ncbi:S9 family peptidase [Kineobactrum salinum]|uniref:S9 family peptidase n=1 Tax=Kineobactrum salinum TaxID=2708301 RepID=A0A6C0U3I2_9GAMM|nr:S9 family peptidase [Kineobactrum salinum]QIB66403.1 S9 family peptidase [Kineobactrum salinum]